MLNTLYRSLNKPKALVQDYFISKCITILARQRYLYLTMPRKYVE